MARATRLVAMGRHVRRKVPRKADGSVLRPEDVRTSRLKEAFSGFSRKTSELAGGPWSFALAVGVVLAWAVTGPIFGFSDTWQLFINTGTTIVTFLMVFLIQNSQNKDTQVLQLKLDELLAASEGASNRLIGLEDLSEAEVRRLQVKFQHLAAALDREGARREAESVEEEDAEGNFHPARSRGRGRSRTA